MLARLLSLVQRLVDRTVHPSDTERDIRAKRVLVPLLAVVPTGVPVFLWPVYGSIFFAMWYAATTFALMSVIILAYVLRTRRLPIWMVETFLVVGVLCSVVSDWSNAAALMPRVWPWVVMLMDVMLALGIRNAIQFTVLGITLGWVTLSAVEGVYRLGLYDIPYWSQADHQYFADASGCSDPPCAQAPRVGLIAVGNAMFPLLLDYGATRSFATGMQTQTDRLVASVELAEQIAESLVLFDLEAAGESLRTHRDGLPSVLCDCFEQLLHNLASYRPYLPQSCLAGAAAQQDDAQSPTASDNCSDAVPRPTVQRASRRSPRASFSGPSDTMSRSSKTSLSTFSHSPTVPEDEHTRQHATRTINAPQTRRLTLLQCNRSGLLSASGIDRASELSAFLAAEVSAFASSVAAQKGIVDQLSADHLSASFGALRTLGSHRAAAVRCGMALAARGKGPSAGAVGEALGALPATAAACTGRALCGDFGSAAAQRFMVVGGVSALAAVAERVAAAWGVQLLIDDLVREDTEADWDSRLRAAVTFPKRGSAQFCLWDVAQVKKRSDAGEGCDEWMYELEAAAPNPWERYNRAVRLWCAQQWEEAQAAAAAAAEGSDDAAAGGPPGQVTASLAMLRDCIASRQQPPVGVLHAARAPGPAPVHGLPASGEQGGCEPLTPCVTTC